MDTGETGGGPRRQAQPLPRMLDERRTAIPGRMSVALVVVLTQVRSRGRERSRTRRLNGGRRGTRGGRGDVTHVCIIVTHGVPFLLTKETRDIRRWNRISRERGCRVTCDRRCSRKRLGTSII